MDRFVPSETLDGYISDPIRRWMCWWRIGSIPKPNSPLICSLMLVMLAGRRGGFQLDGPSYCLPIGNVNYTCVSDGLSLWKQIEQNKMIASLLMSPPSKGQERRIMRVQHKEMTSGWCGLDCACCAQEWRLNPPYIFAQQTWCVVSIKSQWKIPMPLLL